MFQSDEKCTDEKNFKKKILLTTCHEDEFTCGDGSCVTMKKRCDKIINCPNDPADEEDCNMVTKDSTYNKDFAPVKINGNGITIETEVSVQVDLLNILKINEIESLFSCQLRLFLTWKDERLQFNNLKKETSQNSLSQNEKGEIWIPNIIFRNTELREGIKIDEKSSISIEALDDFKVAKDDTLDNTMIFEGSQNPITYARAFKGT